MKRDTCTNCGKHFQTWERYQEIVDVDNPVPDRTEAERAALGARLRFCSDVCHVEAQLLKPTHEELVEKLIQSVHKTALDAIRFQHSVMRATYGDG